MKGILVNYEYCTGCHSCEVACKKILNLPEGEFGIKLTEIRRSLRGQERHREVGMDVHARAHQGVRHVCRPRRKGQVPHVRAALPGVVHVPRRG